MLAEDRFLDQESPLLRTPSKPEPKAPILLRGEGSASRGDVPPWVFERDSLRGRASGGWSLQNKSQ